MIGDTHPALIQRIEDSIGEGITCQDSLDVILRKNIHRAARRKLSKSLGANTNGFAFVYEGCRAVLQCAGDGRRFTVIKGLVGRAGYEAYEMLCPGVSEPDIQRVEARRDARGNSVPS